ncbi:tetratricopeptide repeat protein [Massilia sp. W12]|uniref:O-linked N-acetylglucosamine transferase family protein n=1 Tax=Massilia sp. W12 TaxID=3126507 RepID=UPI0030CEA0A2
MNAVSNPPMAQAMTQEQAQQRLQDMLQMLAHAVAANQVAQVIELANRLASVNLLPIVELFTSAETLARNGRMDANIALYQNWLAHTDHPVAYAAWFNLAVNLSGQEQQVAAEAAYREAIASKPDFIEAHLNLGTLLEKLGRPDEALDLWRKTPAFGDAQKDKALHVQAYNNLGRLLEIRKQLLPAREMMEKALALDPAQTNTLTHWVHVRQKMCEWPTYTSLPGISVEQAKQATSALALLSASDDPAVQLASARRFVADKVIKDAPRLAPPHGYAHQRLRIGYLSSDFCAHAVSILTAELYELHDRKRVEVYGFCWSREDGSPLRARVVQAFDHHIRIGQMTDRQAAECIRAHEIDILIDLHGLTSGTRPDIMAYKPAPVQMTYLGFPGTSAMPHTDYVLSDERVLPPALAEFFSEKPAYLPRCFQINDRKREVGPRPERASLQLRDDQFVFCSFNNNFKITEPVFACWMRILQRCPHAVLWLVADNPWVQNNLRQAAHSAGIEASRLVFAERAVPAQYLARYQAADLFLDNYPFNAGTTASDALWAGLPLITMYGRTFSSRMAMSLLHAVDLPQLAVDNLAAYEELAVSLAHDPAQIAALKQHLQQNRMTCALFDSPRFVKDLEDIYERLAVHPAEQPTAEQAAESGAEPLRSLAQTPINDIYNVDVLNMMRKDCRKVVEVGSSSGVLARAYREQNPACEYVGIEVVQEYAERSRAHCQRVIYGDVEKLPDAEFASLQDADCWVFADALEHLYDPWRLLRRIHDSRNGAVEVVACIPNGQHWGVQSCLNSGRFIYQDAGLLDRTHIRWFTRITILDMFASCGFQITSMIARNMHLPNPEQQAAIRAMAQSFGHDPEQAMADAIPFQYVLRAVSV